MNDLLTIRGKRLYVETAGDANRPALFYLHGGPGTGSYDFMYYQKERLSQHLYLVAIDQRGVLRSDPIGEGEVFGLQDVVEDCEALRVDLGIKKWAVLGHSFGGLVALRYALAYPAAVSAVLFENPTFDFPSSLRTLLRGAAAELRGLGDEASADECLQVAGDESAQPAQLLGEFGKFGGRLGPVREHLYVHGEDKQFYDRLVSESPMPSELWGRAGVHSQRLLAEEKVYESLLPRLADLTQPALLIRGQYDLVCNQQQAEAFAQSVPNGQVEIFEHSGHFTRVEEADRFAATVTRFLLT